METKKRVLDKKRAFNKNEKKDNDKNRGGVFHFWWLRRV